MNLIIGGAYMGKRTFAMERYGFSEEDICDVAVDGLDFRKPCSTHLEAFVSFCIQREMDAVVWFQSHRDCWRDSVLICRDISAGIVPLQPEDRRWREETGRLLQYLAGEAEHVYRVFCGLGVALK